MGPQKLKSYKKYINAVVSGVMEKRPGTTEGGGMRYGPLRASAVW